MTLIRDGRREERRLDEVNQFATQMDAQALAILGGPDVTSTGKEGAKDIRILQAIYEAARTGQTLKL